MTHSINLTHDGTLILRIPKGYKVDKVVVEEMETENRVEYVPDTNVGELVNKSGDLVKGLVNNEVPSVQPTHPTPSNTLGALDCVSRRAAIDEIDEWIKAFRENGHKESAADACLIQDGIIQLPSAKPRKGKWISNSPVTMKCDQCEYIIPDWFVTSHNFCPNCGADMRGSEQV